MKPYELMQEILKEIPDKTTKNEVTRWVSDFNAVAKELEEDIQHDDTGAEDQVSLPPWEARIEKEQVYLYCPPLIRNKGRGAGKIFEAVRLRVNARSPVSGIHVNARSIPVDDTFKINGQAHFTCVIINTNAEDIKDSPLIAVFYLWDSIARIGIEKGLKHGLITERWVNNVFQHANACNGSYPFAYYKHGNKANEYLATLYRLCASRGITQDDLHGEGWMEFNNKRGTDRTYRNSWIDEKGTCSCCKNKKALKYGWGRYPYGSILSHVKSIRHQRNAAEFLLKMNQEENIDEK